MYATKYLKIFSSLSTDLIVLKV